VSPLLPKYAGGAPGAPGEYKVTFERLKMKKKITTFQYICPNFQLSGKPSFYVCRDDEIENQKGYHGTRASKNRFEKLVESGLYKVWTPIHNDGLILLVCLSRRS
jgi:hypothetical protein